MDLEINTKNLLSFLNFFFLYQLLMSTQISKMGVTSVHAENGVNQTSYTNFSHHSVSPNIKPADEKGRKLGSW